MSQTTLNGTSQIRAGTLPVSALVSGFLIPTANLTDGASFFWKNGTVTATAAFNMGGFKITNSADPTGALELATKQYVDAVANGKTLRFARVVAVANVASLSGLPTTDGVTLVDGDIQLNTAQTTASQNGPWVVHSSAWTRPTWWAAAATISEGNYFIIDNDGTTYKNTKWFGTNTANITVDTTAATFIQDFGTAYTNGTGLGLAGTTFSVLYGTTSTTATVGNDSRVTGALQTSALGTGVQTALGLVGGAAGGVPILDGSGNLAAGDFPILTGDVTSAGGSLATTINHTAGSGFLKYTDFVFNETPSGTINGSNATFGLANTPSNSGATLELTLNGNLLEPGAGNDFTLATATITMLLVPLTGDKLRARYIK